MIKSEFLRHCLGRGSRVQTPLLSLRPIFPPGPPHGIQTLCEEIDSDPMFFSLRCLFFFLPKNGKSAITHREIYRPRITICYYYSVPSRASFLFLFKAPFSPYAMLSLHFSLSLSLSVKRVYPGPISRSSELGECFPAGEGGRGSRLTAEEDDREEDEEDDEDEAEDDGSGEGDTSCGSRGRKTRRRGSAG